jgi:hypothetical protein
LILLRFPRGWLGPISLPVVAFLALSPTLDAFSSKALP